MFALSTVSILTIVTCFNLALFLSLGLYLREQRRVAAPPLGQVRRGLRDISSRTCSQTSEQVMSSL